MLSHPAPPLGSHTVYNAASLCRACCLCRAVPFRIIDDAACSLYVAFIRSVVATQTFKIPLSVVQFAFRKMEHERDVDEIECLLANLIFRVSLIANMTNTVLPQEHSVLTMVSFFARRRSQHGEYIASGGVTT